MAEKYFEYKEISVSYDEETINIDSITEENNDTSIQSSDKSTTETYKFIENKDLSNEDKINNQAIDKKKAFNNNEQNTILNESNISVKTKDTISNENISSTISNNSDLKEIKTNVKTEEKNQNSSNDTNVIGNKITSTFNSLKVEKNTDTFETINGWKIEKGKEYYYINGIKQKDTYINYYYLNSNGEKIDKIGDFSATLYGATAWTNQEVNIRTKATQSSTKIGTIPQGAKLIILSTEDKNTKYIKIKYNNQIGYVYSNFLMINLPDVIPDMYYEITNANSSIYRAAGYNINGITGTNLYGFTKEYNPKIGKDSYYAPLLYPVAKKLQNAYNIAKSENYNLKVYDSYRPYQTTKELYNNLYSLYKNNSTVKQKINYDNNGNYWGPSWFLAKNYSSHNRGIAIDIALTDANGNDLVAQSPMHTLDTSSIVSYNNSTSNKLKSIMTSAGFETLKSEWWHFEEKDYKNSPVNNFLLY